MTPALERFASHLLTLSDSGLAPTFDAGPPPTLRIPARHPDVGGITIFDEPAELTIEVGDKHHTHFSGNHFDANTETERLELACRAAAEFVADLIADRICVTVDFLGERCIGSSHLYLDSENTSSDAIRDTMIGIKGGNIRSKRYLWSAPIPEKQTEP